MLGLLGNLPVERMQLLVSDFAKGYATPKVDVRGAVIRNDKVVLVRERTDGLWALHGGYADDGRSPQEHIIKEIWEEAAIKVEVLGLHPVRNDAKHAYDADARDFYELLLACDQLNEVDPLACGRETTGVAYFALEELPSLSTGRVIERDIVAAFDFRDTSMCRRNR